MKRALLVLPVCPLNSSHRHTDSHTDNSTPQSKRNPFRMTARVVLAVGILMRMSMTRMMTRDTVIKLRLLCCHLQLRGLTILLNVARLVPNAALFRKRMIYFASFNLHPFLLLMHMLHKTTSWLVLPQMIIMKSTT